MNMYFGNFVSTATTITVLLELAFIVYTTVRQKSIKKWGRRILALALFGLLICCLQQQEIIIIYPFSQALTVQ